MNATQTLEAAGYHVGKVGDIFQATKGSVTIDVVVDDRLHVFIAKGAFTEELECSGPSAVADALAFAAEHVPNETREEKIERLLNERRELAGKFDAVIRKDEIDEMLDNLAHEDHPIAGLPH